MNLSERKTVLVMAGGTGGHVFPALAAANELQQRGVDIEWLGTSKGIEARLVPAAGIKLHNITVSGLRGKGIAALIKAPLQLIRALSQALSVVRTIKPVAVIGMGGFASGPGGVAAWLLGIPLLIHEQNAVPGTTNRLLARFAKRILTGYPMHWGGNKASYIGNPVREEIANIPEPSLRWSQREDSLRLLVLGGSLGAKAINELLPEAVAKISESERPQIWHQCGEAHFESVQQRYKQLEVTAKVEPFVSDMAEAYGWADLVICRAGALTVAELMAAGVGAWLVPLPHAIDDHQTLNARWFVEQGAGEILIQSELTAELLARKIKELEGRRERVLVLAETARSLAKTDAAKQLANSCMEVALG